MNRTQQFLRTSSNIGLTKCWRGKAIAPETPAWLLVAVCACFIWAAASCDAQIEVDAYITDPLSGHVFAINTATNTIVGSPILTGSLPVGVAVSPDGRYTYIANNGSNTVSIIDTVSHAVVGSTNVAPGPIGIAITPDGKYVYVTSPGSIMNNNGFAGNTVSVINAATNALVGSPITVGSGPIGVAFTPNGKFAYVGNNGSDTVSVINAAANMVVGSITIPIVTPGLTNQPIGVAVTPDGRYAYVANNGSNSVSVINTATNQLVLTITLPAGSTSPAGVAITPDGKYVYVADMNNNNGRNTGTVSVISTATNTVVGPAIGVGNAPIGVAVTPDGRYVYVTNSDINNGGTPSTGIVSVISTATNTVFTSIHVGTIPFSFGSFIGPNIIVFQGGPLLIANDAALTPLGFGQFVDFNGGTLKATGDLVTSRTISLLGNGGTIDTNGFNATFSGNIINSGSLTKMGAGTLTLSGNNTYTGGTNIVGGILSISSGSNLGTSGITISNNAELLTTSALFASTRAITLGTGGGTLASLTGTIAQYAGVINGIGALTVGDATNTGTIILTANNAYSSGTNLTNGVLSVSSDSNLGTGNINISNNAELLTTGPSFSSAKAVSFGPGGGTLAGSTGTTATYAGVISGSGRLSVGDAISNGTIVLSAANTYSGGTVLNSGTLVVDNAQALGLGDVVVTSGVLRTDPQPIIVRGNYTQSARGTLQLSLAGSAPGQYDFLNVSGHATLGGTLQLISLNGFQPKVSDKLTLVIAGGGISGKFANVLDPFSPLIPIELVYGQNTLVLEISPDFAAFAQTSNQLAVARQLDAVAQDPREANLISFLESEPIANLPGDFEKISPDSLTALYEISFSAANIQAANLKNRFGEIRYGSTGFSSSLRVSNAPGTMTEGKDGKAVIEPSNDMLVSSPENRWGAWISGTGDFVNVSGDGNGKGYDFASGGVTLGADYRLTKNFAIGIAAGYAHTGTNLTGDGSIDVNSGKAGVYATYSNGGFYLNGYVGGGFNSYDTQRDALVGNTTGNTDGGEFNALISGGYEFHCGGLTFGPVASLQYTYVDFGGFTESGSLAPLRIESKSQGSLRTNLGLSASYTWKAGKVQITPTVRASWEHEYLYSALPIDAQFASGAGSVFTVNGPAVGHDSALIDAGLNIQWTPTIGTYFGYNGQAGRSRYDSNAVICSVHMTF